MSQIAWGGRVDKVPVLHDQGRSPRRCIRLLRLVQTCWTVILPVNATVPLLGMSTHCSAGRQNVHTFPIHASSLNLVSCKKNWLLYAPALGWDRKGNGTQVPSHPNTKYGLAQGSCNNLVRSVGIAQLPAPITVGRGRSGVGPS